jgi:hypothetical protein
MKKGWGVSKPTNTGARGLGTVGSDVSQETRFCDEGLCCDVRFDGSVLEDIGDAGERESCQQYAKVPYS